MLEEANLDSVDPEQVKRGGSVTVSGTFPSEPVDIIVELRSTDDPQSPRSVRLEKVSVKEDGESFTFVIPPTTRLGRYEIMVTFVKAGTKYGPMAVPISDGGTFGVVTGQPIKVNSVYPQVSYPDLDTFSFKIIGEGFSPVKEDNTLFIEGRGSVPVCSGQNPIAQCVNEEIINTGTEIRFYGLSRRDYQGLQNVRVGDQYAEKPIAVTLSQVGRSIPAVVALLILRPNPHQRVDYRTLFCRFLAVLEEDGPCHSVTLSKSRGKRDK